jgi:hypothetical protein
MTHFAVYFTFKMSSRTWLYEDVYYFAFVRYAKNGTNAKKRLKTESKRVLKAENFIKVIDLKKNRRVTI